MSVGEGKNPVTEVAVAGLHRPEQERKRVLCMDRLPDNGDAWENDEGVIEVEPGTSVVLNTHRQAFQSTLHTTRQQHQ